MAVYFVDLDGTLLELGTNRPLPGAVEFVREAKARGDQIVLTTLRSSEWPRDHVLNDEHTVEALARLGIDYDEILFGLGSPRILINDTGAVAYSHPSNAAISADERLRWLGGRSLRRLRLGAGPRPDASQAALERPPRKPRLDRAELLQPISPETPCGPDLRFEATSDLLEETRALRRSASEAEGAASHEAWTSLLDRTRAGLADASKDLELAVLLCEALLVLDGPWGLAEGLSITEELVAGFWAGLHPGVEDAAEIVAAVRVAPLRRLSATSFDASLSVAPLVQAPDGGVFRLRATEQAEFVDGLLRSDPDRARVLTDTGWTSPAALESLWESLAPAALADAVQAVHAAGQQARRLETRCRECLEADAPFDLYLFRSNLLDIEEILRGDRR
jgi:type VI secretion system ImpA family protein